MRDVHNYIKLLLPFLRGARRHLVLPRVADEILYFIEIRIFFIVQNGAAVVDFGLWGRHGRACQEKTGVATRRGSLTPDLRERRRTAKSRTGLLT